MIKKIFVILFVILIISLMVLPYHAYAKWSLKIEKTSTTTGEVGWISESNAQRYWNGMQGGVLYHIGAIIRTEGVNTSPPDSTYEIGLRWEFFDTLGAQIGYTWIPVDQTVASKEWDSVHTFVMLPSTPDSDYCFFMFGPNATGTAWADNFILSSSPWTAGFFGGNCETPTGWMEWHSVGDVGLVEYTDEDAYSGTYSAKLMDLDALADEIVFYSIPYPCDTSELYLFSVYTKKVDVNTDPHYLPANWCGIRDDERIGVTVGFHAAPLDEAWNWLGDNFFYINQVDSMADWEKTQVVASSPSNAAGVSIRARFTSFPTGTVYYDDFAVQKIDIGSNIIGNSDLETYEPFWWYTYGTGATTTWATDEFFEGIRSLKIDKPSTSAGFVGWKSGDQADTYWNNMAGSVLYHIGGLVKTSGVNTSPSDSTYEIGLRWEFFDSLDNLIGYEWLPVDQTVASKDWDSVHSFVMLPDEPDSTFCYFLFGPNATGTAWADNFILSSSPWTAGFFGSNMETPAGWMEWHSVGDTGLVELTTEDAHSGMYSAKLMENDLNADEMVFYSEPYPCDSNTMYHISVWIKKVDVNTDPHYLPANWCGIRDDERIGVTVGFHAAPLDEAWNWLGDNFFYMNQVDSMGGWEKYEVVATSPHNADGVSIRARFTSFPTGTVYFDDFEVREVTNVYTNLIGNADLEIDNPFFFHKVEESGAIITWDDSLDYTGVIESHDKDIVTSYALMQNYPNPFINETSIRFALPGDTRVNLSVYDMVGRKVVTLVDGNRTAGIHTIRWDGRTEDGSSVVSGIYFYRLTTNEFHETRKMMIMR